MSIQLNEIRLNSYYATEAISEYPATASGDSKPFINKRTIRTNELFKKIRTDQSFVKHEYQVNHLFPPNCRYYEKYSSGFFVVIEEPPAFRTITIDKCMANEIAALTSSGNLKKYGYENWTKEHPSRPYRFTLALPYVIFCLAFDNKYNCIKGRVFFRTQQISGFSDILLKAPFLNISDDQTICFGDRINKGPKRSIYSDVNYTISTFWSTEFNPDYIYNYVAYQNIPGLCDYHTWEYYSNIDPMFIYTADWIQVSDTTIGTETDMMKKMFEENNTKEFGYNTLANLFHTSSEEEIMDVPGMKNIKDMLLFDVAKTVLMNDEIFVDIGDSFKNNKGEIIYVDSYMGFRKMINPMYISLERFDGKLLKWKLTSSVNAYISEKIKNERHFTEATLPNGMVIKPGDILQMKNIHDQEIYRKVHYIRPHIQRGVEARLDSEYYIIDNIEKDTKVIDLTKPKYYEMTLNTDDQYIIIQTKSNTTPIISIVICNFIDIVPNKNSKLIMRFESPDKEKRFRIPMDENSGDRKIYNIPSSSSHRLPSVFVMGRHIKEHSITDNSFMKDGQLMVLPNMGVLKELSSRINTPYPSRLIGKFVQGNKFKLEGWNHIYEFEIGDKVVVANWEDPHDMLTVKQIQGFVENEDTGDVLFTLVNKNNDITNFKYIDGQEKIAKLGSVRKIINKWDVLSAGMKIIANKAGISMFPKKDTNIIIGFLYDTGGSEPLVLCSNANTLWYSDVIEKFNVIKMDDARWKKKIHAPIVPSKMRYQAGDILKGRSYYKNVSGYLAYKSIYGRTIRAININEYCLQSTSNTFKFDKIFTEDVIFDSFPNPRYTASQENLLGFINVYPNFHGMFTEAHNGESQYSVINDRRSILNVSSNSE